MPMEHDRELDHFSDQAREECEVCSLRAERDRLRAIVEAVPAIVEQAVRQVRADRDRNLAGDPDTIRDAVVQALAALDRSALWAVRPMDDDELMAAHYGPGQMVNANGVAAIVAERDRLRAALRAVMAETGTSTLAHHYARDALAVEGDSDER